MDTSFASVFYEIALLVLLAAGVGFVGLLLRQPLVVAFIAVGVLAGPDALGLVSSTEFIETLSQISIAVLLFLVGLKLDVSLVRNLGRVAVATGLGQVTFTAFFGYLICLALGLDPVTSLYISIALTFSSTIIIVKLLSDKQEIGALHGKIALGFLIVQDIFVVLAMVTLSAIGVGMGEDAGGIWDVAQVFIGGAVMVGAVVVFIRYIASPLLGQIARSPELMVIFAVGWAASLAALGDVLGFGKELGGLLAGVSLASTEYREAISSRLASLRDFLLLFFFINLGASLQLSTLGDQIGPAIVLSLFVLIGNPLIVLAIMGYMGYRKRTGFLAGLTVAQISEFSLIFMAMGITIGHVGQQAMGLVTLVGLVTIALSVYMITWSHKLFEMCEPYLGLFERKQPHREQDDTQSVDDARNVDFIIFGLGRYGCRIGNKLHDKGYRVLGIDFDPEALVNWRRMGLEASYGDATDPEFVAHLDLTGVQAVVSAVPRDRGALTEADPQLALLHGLKSANYKGKVFLSVQQVAEAEDLLGKGASVVLKPFDDAADYAVRQLTETSDS
ncbi:transporter (CPA2 family) [Roseinatronobacter thiooxidans]|uniref:Transporter (CPA2 family) n=1 Tax=Roseinatronobacter thiooxidans TaxID=121821 RepID=A0A2W7R4M2_9RHOB|nr:cation:proton antiporter [Roseinatronobacter thiooxidans]PZX45635.1 transporter (CPA2 family) [Roseinatronobacter thiooxidans]